MPTKTIVVPAVLHLDLGSAENNRDYPFREFVDHLLSFPVWQKDFKHVKAAFAIDKAFASPEPEQEVQLAEEDWKILRGCLESPPPQLQGLGLVPAAARQMLPYMDAIMEPKS